MITAEEIEAVLLSICDEKHAVQLRRYFKTDVGQYGEGDKFIGLRNPQVRSVVKESWRLLPLAEAMKLALSPIHEVRLCGLLIMVEKYLRAMKKNDSSAMSDIVDNYVSLHSYINNWDLVDLSAVKIVGNHERLNPDFTLMNEWIKPSGHSIWQQRIAMVSTWILIRAGRQEVCFGRAEELLSSSEDLLHKAAGWMLREAWKQGFEDEFREFLCQNVERMPSVMLSYACEKMPYAERHYWQLKRKGKN